jgi:hypothetical protein
MANGERPQSPSSILAPQSSILFPQPQDQDHQVDHEQQHDRQLQHQHRPVVLIGRRIW